MLDYRIDTFLTLCECLNYHKTAELLHITQPAVSQHIRFLEKQYGCTLFSYDNHTLKKTESAVALEEYARAAKIREYRLREKIGTGSRQKFRIGATKTIGDYYLKEHIETFLANEEHELDLVVDNTEHLLGMLEHNELDFAVIEGFFDRDRFEAKLLSKQPFVGICAKNHPFAGREVEMEELLHETLIHREAGSGTRAILEQSLNAHNESISRFRRRIGISSFPLILSLVKQGLGVSFVYDILAASDPDIARFTLRGEPIVREFNVVFMKDTDESEKISIFLGI
ncbi:MAG: LysR family transcriptional regulator [Clostridia bacterium]|nr:LysR family transcriptional regulator [Clostridia bacterium]